MCNECGWEKLNAKITRMVEKSSKYNWAQSTLVGIYRTSKERSHATENQTRAVLNIEAAGKRRRR